MILDLLKSEEKMEVIKKQVSDIYSSFSFSAIDTCLVFNHIGCLFNRDHQAAQQSKEYQRVLESESNLKKEIKDLSEIVSHHSSAKQDLDNLKKQAKQQQDEYLRMADENTAMDKKLKGIKSEGKKSI